ncbi:hypothetical protein AGMMS50268_03650 [Spirochaetia bacterium]|nr:hypothetical protein AGMMS50268_03650 [Spirochaetia bacterium]
MGPTKGPFLSAQLKELGIERPRTAEARYWTGIMVVAEKGLHGVVSSGRVCIPVSKVTA